MTSSSYSISSSQITGAATKLATQATTTSSVAQTVRLPQVGPATGSPAAAAAWSAFEAVLQLKISQLGSGMANDASAMHAMVGAYGRTEGATSSSLQQTASSLGAGQ